MTVRDFHKHIFELVEKYPAYSDEIYSLYTMAMDNIGEGESPDNEIDLALRDIDEIIHGHKLEA